MSIKIPPGYVAVTVPSASIVAEPVVKISTPISTKEVKPSMSNKFVSFLEAIGKDFEKGLTVAVKAAPTVDALANFIFPASVAITTPATLGLNLLQNSIISIEQKYAASGIHNGTGAQKTAEVLALSGPAATALLTQAGVPNVDTTYISNLINIIVAGLNLQPAVAVTSTATAAQS